MKRFRYTDEEDDEPESGTVYRRDLWLETLQFFITELHNSRKYQLDYVRLNIEAELQLCLLIVCEPWLIPFVFERRQEERNDLILKMLYSCEMIDMLYQLIDKTSDLRCMFVTLTSIQRTINTDEVPRNKQMHSINSVSKTMKLCMKNAMELLKRDTSVYGDVTGQMDDGSTTSNNKGVYSKICKLTPTELSDTEIEKMFRTDCEILYLAYYRYLKSKYNTFLVVVQIDTTDTRAINRAFFIVWQLCKQTRWYDTSFQPPWMIYNYKYGIGYVFVEETYLDLVKRVQLMNRRFAWYMRPSEVSAIDFDPIAPHIMNWFEEPDLRGLCMMTIAMSIVDFSTSRLSRMILKKNSAYYHVYSLLPSVIARWADKDARKELCNFHFTPSTNTTIVNVVLGFILQEIPHYIRFDVFCAIYREINRSHPAVLEKYQLLFEWWGKRVTEVCEERQPKPNKPVYGSFVVPTDLDPDGWNSSDEADGICAWITIDQPQHITLDAKRSLFKHQTKDGKIVANGLLQEIYYMATDNECMPWNLGRIIMKAIVISISLPSVRRLNPPTIKVPESIEEYDKHLKPDVLFRQSLSNTTALSPPIEEDLLEKYEKKALMNFLDTMDLIIPIPATDLILDLTEEPKQHTKPVLRSWILSDTKETCNSTNVFPVYTKTIDTLQTESTEFTTMKSLIRNLYHEHNRVAHQCRDIQVKTLFGDKRHISVPQYKDSIMYK